jgi:hypothetical protein
MPGVMAGARAEPVAPSQPAPCNDSPGRTIVTVAGRSRTLTPSTRDHSMRSVAVATTDRRIIQVSSVVVP